MDSCIDFLLSQIRNGDYRIDREKQAVIGAINGFSVYQNDNERFTYVNDDFASNFRDSIRTIYELAITLQPAENISPSIPLHSHAPTPKPPLEGLPKTAAKVQLDKPDATTPSTGSKYGSVLPVASANKVQSPSAHDPHRRLFLERLSNRDVYKRQEQLHPADPVLAGAKPPITYGSLATETLRH